MDRGLERFRQLLQEKSSTISSLALEELEASAERLVRLYLGKQKRLRPSAVARELKAMAKGLKRAAGAAERLGEQGMTHLFAASHAYAEADNLDPRPHVDYLSRMARWAERAAGAAVELSKSAGDDKRGRAANQNLRSLIVNLMVRFQTLLGRRPTHTISTVEEGGGVSLFDYFVKEAIAKFAPSDLFFEPREIDDAIRWALPSRDFEEFTPPPLQDE
jgi:hypothetical protein